MATLQHHTTRSLRFSQASKAGLALAVAIGGLIGLAQPGFSLSEEESYALCSKYPHNSQCEGYDIPVPLSRRGGDEGVCALNAEAIALTDQCKVSVEGDAISVYVEQGEQIAAIGDERRTTEFVLSMSDISTLSYSESESVNTEKLITNTLLLGVWGVLATRPDKVSQIEIQFAPDAADLETSGNLVFETGRSNGRDMRDRLQESTGLTPRTSL